jgi:hydrogenase expression/formation protein HypC
MCLGIPGKIVHWISRDDIAASAEIEFAGIKRVCQMACVPDAAEGDYVIVHAGVAISRLDRAAAEQTLAELAHLGDDDGWSEEVSK